MNNSQWSWQEWQGLPYLRCDLLQNWQHGFFTQQFSPQLPEDLVQVLQPEAQVYRVKQVHGNRVLPTANFETGAEADGLVATEADAAVWVCSADCTPALIADRTTGKVAAVHAGWRGTAQRIIPESIHQLIQTGSKKADLVIALGPAIAGEVYQVSKQVGAEVGASILAGLADNPLSNSLDNSLEKSVTADKVAPKVDPEEILAKLAELPNSPILSDPHPGRVRLDVRRVNTLQMLHMGIEPEQISIAPHCTYQQPEYFFSYRRQPQKKVQWSGIVSQ
ncbi:MAG: peptidoglycan editing factor PgeF [Coleofasciculaceae cyanobacterium SM2_1_6]|nr:peptidoglycan editing factor PgeF [Coleofasciculaceae cyanobacterium SM2_1_6]